MTTIKIRDAIKEEIAEKVVDQAHPDYSKQAMGEWFVVDGEKLMHSEHTLTRWNPWPGTSNAVSVDNLVFTVGGATREEKSFSPVPTNGETEAQARERAIASARSYVPDQYETEKVETPS